MSLTAVCAWAAFWLALGSYVRDEQWTPLSWQSLTLSSCLIGVSYGFGSAFCWMATAVRHPIWRMVLRILIVVSFSFLLSHIGTQDWIRQAVNLAGMVIVQTIWFAWWRVPSWVLTKSTLAGPNLAARPNADAPDKPAKPTRRQFQIADLLAITTALACLLALAIRYSAPMDTGVYWGVLVAVWLLAPGIATCMVLAALAESPSTPPFQTVAAARVQAAAGIAAVTALGVGLAIAEGYAAAQAIDAIELSYLYSILFLCYGATHFVFGVAGRIQTKKSSTPPAPNEEETS